MNPVMSRLRKHPFVAAVCVFIAVRIACSFFVGVTTCNDGWQSSSIGRRGACSWHHGVGTNWGSVLANLASVGVAIWVFVILSSEKESSKTEELFGNKVAEPPASTSIQPQPQSRIVEKQLPIMAPENKPKCPRCGGAMRLRDGPKGKYRGSPVWSCATNPNCKGTLDIYEMARGRYPS